MQRRAGQQSKRQRGLETLSSWDAVLAVSMQTHVVACCRNNTDGCQLSFFSVPSRLVKVAESEPGRLLGAFTELHVHPPSENLQTEVDDGTGAQPVFQRPPAPASNLTCVRVMHAAPYRQHLVRKTAQYEDMFVSLHKDLYTKTPVTGEQHDVAALPSSTNPAFSSFLSLSTLQCSPQDILVWTRGDARFYLRGSEGALIEEHILAVTALVRAGAWGAAVRTFEELIEEPFPGLIGLHESGKVELVRETGLYRSWRLLVPEEVLMSYPLSMPKLLFDHGMHTDVLKMTMFQLLTSLQRGGWEIATRPCTRRRRAVVEQAEGEPENPDSASNALDCQTILPKVVYPAAKGLPHRHYLIALLSAEELAKVGIVKVEHGRAQKYYTELLEKAGLEVSPKQAKRRRAQLLEIDDGGGQMEQGSSIGRMNIDVSDDDLDSIPSQIERELAELSSDG